jgi:hypothetical protein
MNYQCEICGFKSLYSTTLMLHQKSCTPKFYTNDMIQQLIKSSQKKEEKNQNNTPI